MTIKNSLIILDKSTQFDDFQILSSNNVKVIAVDYETHQKLEKKNISHDLFDDYLEKNQREKLYDYVLTKYTWYDKLSRKKDFEYNNINILSLMSPLELHEFLLTVMIKFFSIKNIINKNTPDEIFINENLSHYIRIIKKNAKINILKSIRLL